jgi:hypothetical protein
MALGHPRDRGADRGGGYRREGLAVTYSIDETKMRLEVSQGIFADRLGHFVKRWGPKDDPQDLYDFQMDMMRLFVDAMRTQNSSLSYGIDNYASQFYQEMSLRPLNMIFREPTK